MIKLNWVDKLASWFGFTTRNKLVSDIYREAQGRLMLLEVVLHGRVVDHLFVESKLTHLEKIHRVHYNSDPRVSFRLGGPIHPGKRYVVRDEVIDNGGEPVFGTQILYHSATLTDVLVDIIRPDAVPAEPFFYSFMSWARQTWESKGKLVLDAVESSGVASRFEVS